MSETKIKDLNSKIKKLSAQRDELDAEINMHKAQLQLTQVQFQQRQTISTLRRAINIIWTLSILAALAIVAILLHQKIIQPNLATCHDEHCVEPANAQKVPRLQHEKLSRELQHHQMQP